MKTHRSLCFLHLALLLAASSYCPAPLAAETILNQWNFNSTNSTLYRTPSSGIVTSGTIAGFGNSSTPSGPLSSQIVNGAASDPGTVITNTSAPVGTWNYNRSVSVPAPILTVPNTSTGITFLSPTTGYAGQNIKLSWSQAVGFRGSRYYQLFVSTNGTAGPFTVPSGGTGSSISQVVTGLNSGNNTISGTATVSVSSSGLIEFRTIDGNWLNVAVGTNGAPANFAAGFVDNISYTLPTGQGFEDNANFAFAIATAWDPNITTGNGTTRLVSSFAGTDSTNLTSGYVTAPGSGGSARLDLMTVSAVTSGPAPTISATPSSLSGFTTTNGTASTSRSLVLKATPAGNLTITAPAGFEVSSDNATFSANTTVFAAPGSTIASVYRGAFGNYTTATGKIWNAGSGSLFPNQQAFAAITSNGSVVTWGRADTGGNSTSVAGNLTSNVTAVYSNLNAFAALKRDGSVVTWGFGSLGGNSSSVSGNLASGVTSISSTTNAFAALKSDGSVVTWGFNNTGGNSTAVAASLSSNVTAVYSTTEAFAALKSDGSVVTWGSLYNGGDSTAVAGNLTSNVTAVYSTNSGFAAVKSNGSVVTWGFNGGDSTAVAGNLTSNVTAVYSTNTAFAALKSDGSVVTWGSSSFGGDSSTVAGSLTSNVTAVNSTGGAFAALKSDGSVVTWGSDNLGGNSTAVAGGLTSNVTAVYSNYHAFAALKGDGSLVVWGDAANGGNSAAVAGSLTSNVTAVYSTKTAFAALKADGSVVTWGDAANGGNSTAVSADLASGVTSVYSTESAFAALKADGSVVTWGNVASGGSGGPANIGAAGTLIYTRIASTTPLGPISGNLTIASPGAETQSVALSGTVVSPANPAISVSPGSLSGFTASLGSASTALPLLVGGTDLTANLTITAPAGFEISGTGDVPFAPSLDLAPVNGTVASTSVYARLAASAPAGANSGNITLASTGATSQQVAVSGTVTLPYEDWVAYWNTQSGSFTGATAIGTADPDGDGYSNTTEFAFDGDPLSPTASLITVAPSGGNLTVTFLARVGNGTVWSGGNATGNGLDYQIQGTADLILGFGPANDVSNIAPANDQTGIQPADFPYVRWEFQAPISGEKKFYRVRAVPQGDQ